MTVRRDPTGMTAAQARREAELRFTKHPAFGVVYKHDVMEATVAACCGQYVTSGRKTTRGCGQEGHQQPCPGGPLVYTIARRTKMFRVIESRADSWRAAIAKIDARRAEERRNAAEYNIRRRQ